MPMDASQAREVFERLTRTRGLLALADAVTPGEAAVPPRLGRASDASQAAVDARWRALRDHRGGSLDDEQAALHTGAPGVLGPRHAENLIGRVELPLGVAGPLRVCGTAAAGDHFVPMATSETALVASCTRGAHAIGRAGGCAAAVLSEGVVRAPAFLFGSLAEAGRFLHWLSGELPAVTAAAKATSGHAKLENVSFTLEGCHAYLRLTYRTGEAAGQNMVTLATESACRWIAAHTPVEPLAWYVEANFSGDKKATAQAFSGVRGRKVVAEVELPGRVVRRFLRTTPAAMERHLRPSRFRRCRSRRCCGSGPPTPTRRSRARPSRGPGRSRWPLRTAC